MKIWGNDLKVGDTIYYEYDYDIRQSTVKERDGKTFKMPSLIMENGDRIFVNSYYYTEKQEVVDNVLEDLKLRCKTKLEDTKKQIQLLKFTETTINDKLKEIEKFEICTDISKIDENFFNCSLEDYKNIVGKCFRHGNIVLKVVGIRDDFDNPYYESCHYEINFLYEEFRNLRDGWNIKDYIWLQDRVDSMYIDEEDRQKYLKFCITPFTEMNISREGMYQLGKDGKLYVGDDCSGECYTCFEEMNPEEFERIRMEVFKSNNIS